MTASPCINLCRMDPDTARCVGCLRTLDEITHWSHLSDEAKLDVLAAIAIRQKTPEGQDAPTRRQP